MASFKVPAPPCVEHNDAGDIGRELRGKLRLQDACIRFPTSATALLHQSSRAFYLIGNIHKRGHRWSHTRSPSKRAIANRCWEQRAIANKCWDLEPARTHVHIHMQTSNTGSKQVLEAKNYSKHLLEAKGYSKQLLEAKGYRKQVLEAKNYSKQVLEAKGWKQTSAGSKEL